MQPCLGGQDRNKLAGIFPFPLAGRQSPCSDHDFIVQKNGVLSVSSRVPGETGFVFAYPDDGKKKTAFEAYGDQA